jgi:hypothetical protein
MPPIPDGSLSGWDEIAEEYAWEALLLGNGLSINVWPAFGYASLFDHVRGGGLTRGDVRLFSESPNFERVLADLNTAIRVSEQTGVDPAPFYVRYRRIQRALSHAVRQVHLNRTRVPSTTLAAIRAELVKYEWLFTTSYDLLVYWAMGYGGTYRPFIDLFKYNRRCEFDPDRAVVYKNEVPIYFLHGALHLVVGGTGATWKLTRTDFETLLDQFGQPIAGDPQARPLLVTEGSARDKLQAIEGNDYLSHALKRLREVEGPLVVFGSSLSVEDQHLVDALNEHRDRPIAVSMYPGRKRTLRERQGSIYGRLQAKTLLFFDSTTHPLGSDDLRAP